MTEELPRAKFDPDGGQQPLDAIPELSAAIKFHVAIAEGEFILVGVTTSGELGENGGHDSVGGV